MNLSIIILTYNSSKYISNLLESLIDKNKSLLSSKKLEIIVADNNSSDDTEKEVRKYKEHVMFTQNGGNLGFAAGNNKASEKANGEVLIFMNPDTKFLGGELESLVEELDHKHAGIVGGKIENFHGGRELSCGKFYTLLNVFILCLGLEEKLGVRFAPHIRQNVDFVSGAFLCIKKELFNSLGGFDEHFFMYIEDQELCFRVKQDQKNVVFLPSISIKHVGQGSSNRTFAVVNIYKGLVYFHKKHMGIFSEGMVRLLLKSKAFILVNLGKLIHNLYLVKTYEEASQSI